MGRSVGVLLLLLLGAAPAHAHAVGVSRGEYRAEGELVRADVVFARTELAAALASTDIGALSTWLRRGIVVTTPAGPCEGDGAAAPTEQDRVALRRIGHGLLGPPAAPRRALARASPPRHGDVRVGDGTRRPLRRRAGAARRGDAGSRRRRPRALPPRDRAHSHRLRSPPVPR